MKWRICEHGKRPSFCKDCQRQYDKDRANLSHRVTAREVYRQTAAGKDAGRRAHLAYVEKNKDRRAAHVAVGNALRDGRLFRKPCEVCGATKVHAHHDDYAKPLEVRWLCRRHHVAHHKEASAKQTSGRKGQQAEQGA